MFSCLHPDLFFLYIHLLYLPKKSARNSCLNSYMIITSNLIILPTLCIFWKPFTLKKKVLYYIKCTAPLKTHSLQKYRACFLNRITTSDSSCTFVNYTPCNKSSDSNIRQNCLTFSFRPHFLPFTVRAYSYACDQASLSVKCASLANQIHMWVVFKPFTTERVRIFIVIWTTYVNHLLTSS